VASDASLAPPRPLKSTILNEDATIRTPGKLLKIAEEKKNTLA
jgi:hypothetical protein